MKTIWKIFELVEISIMDEWQGHSQSYIVMQEWTDTEELTTELEAIEKLKEITKNPNFKLEGLGFEIKKVLVP